MRVRSQLEADVRRTWEAPDPQRRVYGAYTKKRMRVIPFKSRSVWCRRGESEYSGALKTRKLLVFRDAKNAEHGRIGPNWNVSGTRDFHFSCQFCGVAGWAALRSSSISARTGSGAADNTRSLSSYPVARTRLLGALPAVSSHCRLHLGTLNLRGIYCSSSSRCLSSNSGSANA